MALIDDANAKMDQVVAAIGDLKKSVEDAFAHLEQLISAGVGATPEQLSALMSKLDPAMSAIAALKGEADTEVAK